MYMKYKFIILPFLTIAILFIVQVTSLAQLGLPLVKNYTPEVTKGGIQNWQITQDERGVIYVANNFGLLQFDGNNWRTYPIDGISKLRSIAYHPSGKIFIGSQGDFGYFESDPKGTLKYHSLSNSLDKEFQNIGETWKTYIINDKIYFCTFDNIYIYDVISKTIEVITHPSTLDISYTSNNKIFTHIPNKGIHTLEGNELVTLPYTDFFSDKVVSAVLSHSNGEQLITTLRNGIHLTNNNKITAWNTALNTFFADAFINSAILLSNGNLAIGTQHEGIFIINQEGKILLNMTKESGLLSRTILSLYEDHNQNLWVGQNNGISFIQLKSPFTLINEASDLQGTGYTANMKDKTLYLGTNNGVYFSENDSKAQLIKGTEGQVYSLQFIKNELFVGHNNGAMKIMNNESEKIPNCNSGSWMFLEMNDKLLNGTYDGIRILKKKSSEKILKVKNLEESSRILIKENDSTVWMSHIYKGIYKITFSSSSDSTSIIHFNHDNGLPSDLFNIIHMIEGQLRVSTENGIYAYNTENQTFKIDHKLNKHFKNDRINALQTDIFGNIYFITSTSVGFLEKKGAGGYEKHDTPFQSIRSLLNDDLPNINIIGSNLVLFGAKEGFILFDRNKFRSRIRIDGELLSQCCFIYANENNSVAIFINFIIRNFFCIWIDISIGIVTVIN